MLANIEEDMDYIDLHGPNDQMMQLCRTCYIVAIQGLMFAKEVATCQTIGKPRGKRIYVAVEQIGQESELVNVLNWPSHSLQEIAESAKKNSITYRVSDQKECIVRLLV